MAREIRETPVLKGQDAEQFIAANNSIKKVTDLERRRIFEGAEKLERFADN